jgi:hypothetical protein
MEVAGDGTEVVVSLSVRGEDRSVTSGQQPAMLAFNGTSHERGAAWRAATSHFGVDERDERGVEAYGDLNGHGSRGYHLDSRSGTT